MKLLNLKRVITILLLIILTISIQGCAPRENPEIVINKYFQLVKVGQFKEAYSLLTLRTQENLSLQDFLYWQEQTREIVEFLEFKVTKIEAGKEISLDGNIYPHHVVFDVEETNKEFYLGEELVDVARHYVVNDNGQWRLYRNPEIKKALANNYMSLGAMYIDGRGKDQDIVKAAENFKKALENSPDMIDAHYSLGVAFMILNKYEDSIIEIKKYLEKSTDVEGKSEAFNVLGLTYKTMGDFKKAKDAFEKSLDYNPKNDFAKNHLESVTRG